MSVPHRSICRRGGRQTEMLCPCSEVIPQEVLHRSSQDKIETRQIVAAWC